MDDDDEVPTGRIIRKPVTHIDYTGWLWKKARKLQPNSPPFKDRFFVLTKDRLLYFKSPQANTAIAEISLADAVIRVITPDTDSLPPPYTPQSFSQRQLSATGLHVPPSFFANQFEIDNRARTYILRAPNAHEFQHWTQLLLKACRSAHDDNDTLVQLDHSLTSLEVEWATKEEDRVERLSVLRHTLRDPVACDFFIGFEVDRGREESVLCYLDCEAWRLEPPPGRLDKGREIWQTYCKRGAAKEVRIDEALREEVRQAVEAAQQSGEWVDKLQAHMYHLLSTASFPAFLASSAFYHAAYATPPPPAPSTPSPSRHHAYAQARVGSLRQDRGAPGTSTPRGPRSRRGESRMRSVQLDEEDMVIVLSDDQETGGGEGAQTAGEEGQPPFRGASSGSLDAEDGEYVSVRKDPGYGEQAGGGQGRGPPPSIDPSLARSPVHQSSPAQAARGFASPMAAQTPTGPTPRGGGPPAALPQTGGGQQTPVQQQQKGGFFKRIFASSADGKAQPPPGQAPQSPPSAAPPGAAPQGGMEKSTADALADFYSKKPIAGGAVVTQGRPPQAGPAASQQRQPPPNQAQQAQHAQQAAYAQQQQRQQAAMQQQQQQQEAQRLQQQQQQQAAAAARAQPQSRPQQPAQPPPKAAPPIPIDFLSGFTSPSPPSSPAPPPPSDPLDMFENLTIQPSSTPSSPSTSSPHAGPAFTAASVSPPYSPATSPPTSPHTHPPAASQMSSAVRINRPPPKPLLDDDDFFGPPTPAVAPPPAKPPVGGGGGAVDPFLDLYGGGGGGGGAMGGGRQGPQHPARAESGLDWTVNALASPQGGVGGAGRGGIGQGGGMGMGMGRGGMGGPGMGGMGVGRGGPMQPSQGMGGMGGMGRGGPMPGAPKKPDEDIFASAYREAQQKR